MTRIPRNHLTLVVRQRNGGPMKDRRAPRGGNRNEQADLLAEAEEERELKMRYKIEGWVEADEGMGWSEDGIREEIEESLSSYGDLSVTIYVLSEPEGCMTNLISSRVCERGTKSCDVKHKDSGPQGPEIE